MDAIAVNMGIPTMYAYKSFKVGRVEMASVSSFMNGAIIRLDKTKSNLII